MLNDNDPILHPLTLSRGSHQPGSGRGCAMNVVSYENGDSVITDYPACSDRMLAGIVQGVNDYLADGYGFLSPENSLIALDLGHATVGTTSHDLTGEKLKIVYVRCAVLAARKVVHVAKSSNALAAIEAAERWADDPSEANRAAAAVAAAASSYAAFAFAAAASYAAAAAYCAAFAASSSSSSSSYAADSAAAAFATAADSAPVYHYGQIESRVELAREIITLFKKLTGTEESCDLPVPLNIAVEKMLVTS